MPGVKEKMRVSVWGFSAVAVEFAGLGIVSSTVSWNSPRQPEGVSSARSMLPATMPFGCRVAGIRC